MSRPYSTKPKYVYMYKDKDGVPYYIGQGSTARALAWQKKPFEWDQIPPYNGNTLHFVEVDLTNKEAYELEEFLIEEIGRVDLGTGTLLNKSAGGMGSKGRIVTKEYREKMSAKAKELHKKKIIGSYKDRTI